MRLEKISDAMLDAFTARTYRDVVVRKSESLGGGPARIEWRSGGPATNVAISHVQGLACAFIGSTEVYSVDLEMRKPRVPEFYAHNFTPREQSWSSECARSLNLDSDWLYTLLWSAKECLLKTPAFAGLSLWDMPSMEINFLTGSGSLKALHDAQTFSGYFESLEAEVTPADRKSRCPAKHFRLAVSGTADLVLTAITRLD